MKNKHRSLNVSENNWNILRKKTKSKTVTSITTIAETEAFGIVFELMLFFTDIVSVSLHKF